MPFVVWFLSSKRFGGLLQVTPVRFAVAKFRALDDMSVGSTTNLALLCLLWFFFITRSCYAGVSVVPNFKKQLLRFTFVDLIVGQLNSICHSLISYGKNLTRFHPVRQAWVLGCLSGCTEIMETGNRLFQIGILLRSSRRLFWMGFKQWWITLHMHAVFLCSNMATVAGDTWNWWFLIICCPVAFMSVQF